MKNLEKFGIQELNAKEIKETDGGFRLWSTGFSYVSYTVSGTLRVLGALAGMGDGLRENLK
jgi:hypothetical protein